MLGTMVGKYTITAKIGQGGMAVVYTAKHTDLARQAVVKVLRSHLVPDEEIRKRFRREAATIASIKHPSIVDVMDCDELADGSLYILMEYLDGENLRERLDRVGSLPIDHAVTVARQATDALRVAHTSGIVHRDLKPANLFLVKDSLVQGGERVKLLDFGIAKLMDGQENSSLVTKSGVIMGTPIYMSPEQCRGAGEVDHRTDFYALGCILFEMMCGRPPFNSKAAGELIVLHLTQPPPPARSFNESIPPRLDAVIARLLAKEVQDRFSSASEVVEALDKAIGRNQRRRHRDSQAPELAQAAAPYVSTSSPGPHFTGSVEDLASSELAHTTIPGPLGSNHRAGTGIPPTERIASLDARSPQGQGNRSRRNTGERHHHHATPTGPARVAEHRARQPQRRSPPVGSPNLVERSRPEAQRPRRISTPVGRARVAEHSHGEARRPAISGGSSPSSPVPTLGSSRQPRVPKMTGALEQAAVPPAQTSYGAGMSTGMLTRITRNRATLYIQVGLLVGACLAGLVYLVMWMVSSYQATTSSSSGVAAGDQPVDAGPAETTQKATIAHEGTDYRPALVALAGGAFMMGSPHIQKWRSKDETPRHEVKLSPFFICQTEITQKNWKMLMRESPSDCKHGCGPNRPVQSVSWNAAVEYFNRLSRKEGLEPCFERQGERVIWLGGCAGYRFPTEAEWEYAARAGTETIYSFGDDPEGIDDHAWHRGNTKEVRPVAQKKPNQWGLYDMHGNTQEWVWDQFERFYPEEPQIDPRGPPHDKPKRVLRGGSFRNDARDLRSAVRYWNEPVSTNWDYGVRCARSQPAQ